MFSTLLLFVLVMTKRGDGGVGKAA
ncbi:hypothetical protein PCC21_029860 [Pectobacterium carotovorum subsp. carotovorum PCC21]|nr:hypothetical protein PCC21_029860 [Pectobacterium carotovorum subsp. carotovorum PCC21]